jgi:acyl dehydratase
MPAREQTYDERDTMLYALGLGVGADPTDRDALHFTYEKELRALPTMATVLGWDSGYLDPMGVNRTMVVHGEQRLTLHKPLPVAGSISSKRRVVEAYDKGPGRGALILVEQKITDLSNGEALATLLSVVFARDDGGFGGPEGSPPPLPEVPDSEPDEVRDFPTLPQAALIYRLSGDRNPLHSDPDFAANAGFQRPILHGLCSFGIAGYAILGTYCDYDSHHLREFDLRFSAPVYPGETIRTEMWRGDGTVQFQSRVLERDLVVLKNGVATLLD